MLSYRRIESEKQFARLIWRAEEAAPRWFRDASYVWTKNYKEYRKFWRNCAEIQALFDDDQLVAAVYFEVVAARSVVVHVSVIAKTTEKNLVRFFRSLLREKRREGFINITGWIFERNRALLDIGQKAGFNQTGLKLDFGASRGKLLRWIEVRA